MSSIILAPCIYFLQGSAIMSAVIGNLVGGLIFFWFDRWLFNLKEREECDNDNSQC